MCRNSTTLIIIVLALSAAGCGRHIVKEPYPVYIPVEKTVKLPAELLKPCPVHEQEDRRVDSYITTAIINTSALRLCAKQIEEIIKLQPEGQ